MTHHTFIKPYSELKFSDDFMFGKVMEDAKLCRKVLETLLQMPVGELSSPEWQRDVKLTRDGKPIRLDIFTREESSGIMYDAEMQNLGKKKIIELSLPERSRYYQALIDSSELAGGESYRSLKESNIIFICTFDPFGMGKYRYSFSEICEEDNLLFLNSGTKKIFYNTTATGKEIPGQVRNLFEYINTGIPVNELTLEIEDIIEQARCNEEWGSEYMKSYVLLQDAKLEGKKETLLNLYKEGLLTEEQVCERLGIALDTLKILLEEYKND